METIFYKGFTIEPTSNPYASAKDESVDYYPTDGFDCEWTGDGWKSNVCSASNLEEAKDEIDEMVMAIIPDHQVEMNSRFYYFPWIEDAVKFASMWNGQLLTPIANP